jgi:hypothetical protein
MNKQNFLPISLSFAQFQAWNFQIVRLKKTPGNNSCMLYRKSQLSSSGYKMRSFKPLTDNFYAIFFA